VRHYNCCSVIWCDASTVEALCGVPLKPLLRNVASHYNCCSVMWRAATTVVAAGHIKSLSVAVHHVVFTTKYILQNIISQKFLPFFLTHNSIKCKQHLIDKTHDYWRHKPLQWHDFSCGAPLQHYFVADATYPNHATSKVKGQIISCGLIPLLTHVNFC
jgi:hypothetical protein